MFVEKRKLFLVVKTVGCFCLSTLMLAGCKTAAVTSGLSPVVTVKAASNGNDGRILSVDDMFVVKKKHIGEENFLKEAQDAIEQEDYEKALKILRKIVTLDPDNTEAAILIINTETMLELKKEKELADLKRKEEEAEREKLKLRMEVMHKSIMESEGRKKAESLFLEGAVLFYSGQYKEAQELFRKGLVLNPEHTNLKKAFVRTEKRIEKISLKNEIEQKLKRRFDDFLEEINRRQEESLLEDEPDIEFGEGESLPELEYIQSALDEEFIFELFPDNWTNDMREEFLRKKSIEIYQEAIKRFPYSEKAAKAYYKIGEHHFANKEYDEAKKSLRQVVSNFFDSPYAEDSAYKIFLIEFERENWEEARILCYDLIDTFPAGEHKKEAYLKLGSIYEAQKNYKKAYSTYLDMTEFWKDPKDRCAIEFKFANLFKLQGDTDMALEKYTEIMEQYKDTGKFDDAQYMHAEILYDLKRYDEAKIEYIDIVQSYGLNPYRFDAFMRLAEIFRMEKDYVKELSMYSQILKSFPYAERLKEVYLLRGKAFRNAGFYLKAIEALRDVVEYFPDDDHLALIVAFDTATCYEKLENISEAYVFLDKIIEAVDVSPDFRNQAIMRKSSLLQQQRNYNGALETYRKMDDAEVTPVVMKKKYYNMGVCSFNLKDYSKTIEYFSFYLEHGDVKADKEDIVRAMVYQIDSAYRIEKYSYGIEVCAKIIENFPDTPQMGWVLYQMGKCHEKMSQYKSALNYYQQLISDFPEHELVRQAGWDIKNIRWNLKDKAIMQNKILN